MTKKIAQNHQQNSSKRNREISLNSTAEVISAAIICSYFHLFCTVFISSGNDIDIDERDIFIENQ